MTVSSASASASASASSAPSAASTGSSAPRARALLVTALVLSGFTMRTSVTSVGAALDDLQRDLPASGGMAGLITTMPVICFAGIGALAPRVGRRLGAHRLLVLALAVSVAGLALRPFTGSAWGFTLVSVAALAGSAVTNVLMPSLVRLHFPERVGQMTALYSTALAVGITAASGLTIPIGDATGGWSYGVASWAVISLLAIVPWLPTVVRDRPLRSRDTAVAFRTLARSRTVWALTVFFGFQSMQAYITFGWFARFLTEHDVSSGTAGLMLAVLTALSIPVSLVVPRVPASRHRLTVAFFVVCLGTAYALMAVAPVATAWVWMVLAGVGGGSFPLLLTLIGTRARTAETTATLSAFVQAIGYLIAGAGPLLFGALFGATDSWALPITLLFVALVVMSVASLPSTTPRFVEDEVTR